MSRWGYTARAASRVGTVTIFDNPVRHSVDERALAPRYRAARAACGAALYHVIREGEGFETAWNPLHPHACRRCIKARA